MKNIIIGLAILITALSVSSDGLWGMLLNAAAIILFGYLAGYQYGKDRALRDNRRSLG